MPFTPIQKVALAGASGLLGTPMLHALLNAGFTVTVLTRHSSAATFPSTAKVLRVDYENLADLTQALQSQDALVSTLTTFSIATQKLLIDAAIAAGVKRFLPSEFGSDVSIPSIRAMPMYKDKIEIDAYMRERCAQPGVEMSWTAVYCSCFLDWGIDNHFYLNLKEKTCTLYDGGEFLTATSPTDWVAEAVVAVLKHADETANREIRVSGIDISQKELLEIAQRVAGGAEGWTVTEVSSQETYEKSMEIFEKDRANVWGWVMGMLIQGIFGKEGTRDFGGKTDNEMLGLRGVTKEEVEGYFRRAVESRKSSKVY